MDQKEKKKKIFRLCNKIKYPIDDPNNTGPSTPEARKLGPALYRPIQALIQSPFLIVHSVLTKNRTEYQRLI